MRSLLRTAGFVVAPKVLRRHSHLGTQLGVAVDILEKYDQGVFETGAGDGAIKYALTPITVENIIDDLRLHMVQQDKEPGLVGKRHNDRFYGIIANVEASFGGVDLYPTVKSRAAQLLYSIVKSHSFIDGNKRIAACVFMHYLEANQYCTNIQGKCKLDPRQLADLIIYIAESPAHCKEHMIRMIEGTLERLSISSV